MSGGWACQCSERKEALLFDNDKPSNRPLRLWRVWTRHWNNSAFVRAGGEPSDYSLVVCLRCRRMWRTKANYVEMLGDVTDTERDLPGPYTIVVDAPDHSAIMERYGRDPWDPKEQR